MSPSVSGHDAILQNDRHHRRSRSNAFEHPSTEPDIDLPLLAHAPSENDFDEPNYKNYPLWAKTEKQHGNITYIPAEPLSRLARISVSTSLIFTILALLLTLHTFDTGTPHLSYISGHMHPSSFRPAEVDTLRRPSQYIGLSRVPEIAMMLEWRKGSSSPGTGSAPVRPAIENNGVSLPPLPNAVGDGEADNAVGPWSVARVNSEHPGRAYPLDSEEGWILLSEQDSVVARFVPRLSLRTSSAVQCAFHAQFPTRKALRDSDRLVTIEGPPDIAPPSANIVFAALAPSTDGHPLYWKTAPPRGRSLGALDVSLGTNSSTPGFPCPLSGKDNTEVWVLMECRGEECRVEYRELAEEPKAGIHLVVL